MKTKDFINEADCAIANDAEVMHRDHEVQMARGQLYNAAQYAIELHRMLKNISERQGLEGWVQAKITKATDYLSSVKHHLEYEQVSQSSDAMMDFVPEGAEYAMDKILDETASAGATGAGSVATAPTGDGGTGFEKAIGLGRTPNTYKNSSKQGEVKFGKGVYNT